MRDVATTVIKYTVPSLLLGTAGLLFGASLKEDLGADRVKAAATMLSTLGMISGLAGMFFGSNYSVGAGAGAIVLGGFFCIDLMEKTESGFSNIVRFFTGTRRFNMINKPSGWSNRQYVITIALNVIACYTIVVVPSALIGHGVQLAGCRLFRWIPIGK